MLNVLVLKNQEIILPRSIQTLGEALQWVEESLLCEGAVVASAILEDKELINEMYRKSIRELKLSGASRLQIDVDVPNNLVVQSLAVACDLAKTLLRRVQGLTNSFANGLCAWPGLELEEIFEESQLLLDLIKHTHCLNDCGLPFDIMNEWADLIFQANAKLSYLLATEDWQGLSCLGAYMLLYVKGLLREAELLQIRRLICNFDHPFTRVEAEVSVPQLVYMPPLT